MLPKKHLSDTQKRKKTRRTKYCYGIIHILQRNFYYPYYI